MSLFSSIELVCLDAGNTVIYLDHARLAHLASTAAVAEGVLLTKEGLIAAEGRAKVRAEQGRLVQASVRGHAQKVVTSWASMVATILAEGGMPEAQASESVNALWPHHVEHNLWSLVPADLPSALAALKNSGRKLALVSNSEGMLERLFRELQLFHHFDVFLDSGILGIEKPDPRIFEIACERSGVGKANALHLGDVYATDVVGARAYGMRCALIDPFEHYQGRHADVPRVASAASAICSVLAESS
jgi:FMN phosphatase YigB (HAD superfamily)